jgi:putative methionine-R-sulfoxide reductase with GAF domain
MRKLFFLPDFHDEDKQRIGQYLNVIILSAIALLSFLLVSRLASVFVITGTNALLVMLLGILVVLRVILQLGHVRMASLTLVTITWVAMTYQAYSNDGVRDVSIVAYVVVILMTSLLLGWQYSIPFFGLSIVAMLFLANQETQGLRTVSVDTPMNTANDLIVIFTLILVMTYLIISGFQKSITRVKASAHELEVANKELQGLRTQLEQRVADRTKALAASTEVSRRLSTILDEKQLVKAVVEQVQTAFDFYHVHIYLRDEVSGNLIMAGGTGDAGAAMLARGHKILKGKGLVGRAAETNSPVLVQDTSEDPNWLPNPLLPDTKSEIAVPISVGAEVLGVLDVQQNVVSGLNQEDVNLLQSIANQVAIGVRNARSYEVSRSQAELETMINTIGQKIQRAGTVEDVLQTAIREVGMALGASSVSASLQPGRTAAEPYDAGGSNGADPKR